MADGHIKIPWLLGQGFLFGLVFSESQPFVILCKQKSPKINFGRFFNI